ncbi:MAG: HD-GYP domain-containing protein [Clostridiales bacterium]|nr:HD-GYP domain-containing protein [Clostridiales bacterium]
MSKLIECDHYLSYTKNPVAQGGAYQKYKDDLLEIIVYKTFPGITKHLIEPKSKNCVKTFTIIKGTIQSLDTQKVLGVGNIVVLKYGSEPFPFKVLEETEILEHNYGENSLESVTKLNQNVQMALATLQEKDQYTYEHSMVITLYVEAIAVRLGYKGIKLRNLIWATTYHDLGKAFIDDEILNKKAPLTEEEYEIIKTHVVKGKDLIVNAFNEDVFNIVLQHHERLDGSGYPHGVKEDEICEEAKIIAICDSYHAMVEDRVYKKGKSRLDAINELKDMAGIKYDKRIVDIAIEVFRDLDVF